jgi:predicted nucleotidyltransferase
MTATDHRIAQTLKRRLTESVPLVELRVFGSRARGDAEDDSDMDVFVEVESLSEDSERRISDIAWEVGFANFLVICPVAFSREQVERSPLRASPLVRNVREEGVVI